MHKPCNKELNKVNQDFMFQIIKVKHLDAFENKKSDLKNNILKFLQNKEHESQLRINPRHPNVISSLYGLSMD